MIPRSLAIFSLLVFPVFGQPNFETALKNLKFRSIGPAQMGGRIDDLAVVESDPRIMYAGAAAGGIFKTVNGGATWKGIFEDQPNPSIGDLALAPSNPSILYVGTGEPNNRQSASWGNGVYKTMDGGVTFQHMGLKETSHIGRIVVHPTDPNIVYVAAQGDLWGPNKERGVYKSTDGGATWQLTLFVNEDTGANDIAIDPESPNILYATMYQHRRTVFGYNGGGPGSGVYRSIDGGSHWTKLGKGLPEKGDVGRCALDIYRRNTNIVYALIQHETLGGVYRSEDKGESWTRMSDTNPRPSYFSQIRVDPNSDVKIWLGGVNIYYSEDGGKTFAQNRFERVHSDVHAIWIDPANSNHMVIGNDGGVWYTHDSGRAWSHLNNIVLAQFYEISYDYQKPYRVCGGLQDNYSWCGPSSTAQRLGIGNEDWFSVQGGDGFYNRIDPTDPNIIYAESQDGNLSRRDLRSSEARSIRPLEPNDQAPRYRFQWNSPLMISAHDPKTIYYGGNHFFKSTDRGDTWQVLGEDLTSNQDRKKQTIFGIPVDEHTLSAHDGVVAWPCLTAIAESPVDAKVLWVGTDDGYVQMTRDGGKTWTNVASHFMGITKGGYVSRIEPSHKEAGTAYITFDNHRSADYGIYVYATKNYGDSFVKLTNGIPQEAGSVHVVREDPENPDLLFAGTEFGIFVTFDRGANWHRMKNGLPTVPVFDIQIHPRDHDLILATHGRGVWIMDNIHALEEMNSQVLTSDLKLFSTRPAYEWKMADYKGFIGSAELHLPNAPNGALLDYYSKTSGPVRVTVKDAAGKQIRQFNARAAAGEVTRIAWDLRTDAVIPVERGGGRGGAGGGRGGGRGGAAAAAPQAENPEEGGGELQTEFGVAPPEERPAGGGGGGGRGGFGAGQGTTAEPGTYTVTIALAGKSDSKTVAVELDPRLQVPASDREKRKQTIETLVSLAKEAEAARKRAVAINTALTGLTAGWAVPNAPAVPDAVKKTAEDLLARSKTVAARFASAGGGRGGGGTGAPPPYTPPAVTQKIGRVLGVVDNYSGAPTAFQIAETEDCRTQLQKDLAELEKLASDVPKLNKAMSDAGVLYFNPGS
jgi:photosystem II stability/assembly factor-like uncharacterized protein